MNTEHPFTVASRYIESIRNPLKKQYARDYYQHIRSGRQGESPNHGTLSAMAAQAVRMNLNEIFPEKDTAPTEPEPEPFDGASGDGPILPR